MSRLLTAHFLLYMQTPLCRAYPQHSTKRLRSKNLTRVSKSDLLQKRGTLGVNERKVKEYWKEIQRHHVSEVHKIYTFTTQIYHTADANARGNVKKLSRKTKVSQLFHQQVKERCHNKSPSDEYYSSEGAFYYLNNDVLFSALCSTRPRIPQDMTSPNPTVRKKYQ